MKLLLTSNGNSNKSIEKTLRELLGKPFNKSRLIFIPTAANVDESDKSWLVNDMNNFKKLNFKHFDILDIAGVPREVWEPQFKKADILVFGGGDTVYLKKCIQDSGLEKILPELLKTKAYVGISAGSMVTAKKISLSTAGILYYEKYKKFNDKNGLGFVDFELRPHLNSTWFPKVRISYLEKIAKQFPYSFYAIDDNTAIKVVDDKISVISEGEWKKFN